MQWVETIACTGWLTIIYKLVSCRCSVIKIMEFGRLHFYLKLQMNVKYKAYNNKSPGHWLKTRRCSNARLTLSEMHLIDFFEQTLIIY